MATNIYLEVLTDVTQNRVKVTLETYVGLIVYHHLGAPSTTLSVNLVKLSENNDSIGITVDVSNTTFNYLTEAEYSLKIAALCNFPVLVTSSSVVIAGLCGVCRGMIKYAQNEAQMSLLGFKGACLLAPAEMSVWTKFCEIDIIKCTKIVLEKCRNGFAGCENAHMLPDEFGLFECHMEQPVRVHNVYKLARELAKEKYRQSGTTEEHVKQAEEMLPKLSVSDNSINDLAKERTPRINKVKKTKVTNNFIHIPSSVPIQDLDIDHTFVEGQQITLADVILYSCYFLMFEALSAKETLYDSLPVTVRWMAAMNAEILIRSKLPIYIDHNANIESKSINYQVKFFRKYSLYKNDSKRYKPKSRIYTKQNDIDVSLAKINQLNLSISSETKPSTEEFDWNAIPYDALPEGGNLPADRLVRKKHQLQSLAKEVLSMAKAGDRIVDFCSGAGHLGIIIAHKLPDCQIILLENKEESLMRAKRRVDQLRLQNVLFFQCNLDYFRGKFDIGTSLHACGVATDIVLAHCLEQKANFVCCPCCYGSIHEMPHITYPRSSFFSVKAGLTNRDCMHIAHCADQAHDIRKGPCNMEKSVQGQYCMDIVDWDRKLSAEERGYVVRLTRLQPEDCTPKNRLLVGQHGALK